MTELLIRKEEFAYARAPAHLLGMAESVARNVIRLGNDFLKKEFLLKSLDGTLYHCQMFLDDVRVHKDFLLGEKNKGLQLMLAGLEYDRFWDRMNKSPF